MAKKTDLRTWDTLVAPALHRIESSAIICRDRARHVKAEVGYLMSRPEWLTRAKAEIDHAKAELTEALTQIESALALYEKIPVEGKDDKND